MRTTCRRRSRSGSGVTSRFLPLPLLLAALLSACASGRGVIFARAETDLHWPPAPDIPRIAYVGQLVSSKDLKPAKSAGESLTELIFGKEPVQGMVDPLAVCTDGAERVFIADAGAAAVDVFDLDTRKFHRWRPPKDRAQLSRPVGLALDPKGDLLVTDSVEGAIFVFDPSGKFLGTFGDNTLKRPVGIAVGRAGRIFVADTGAHQVVVLAPDGEEITRIGRRGVAPGEFNYPTYLTLDKDGRLYVSDSLNFRVQVFGPDLEPERIIGSKGDLPGYFAQPKGVAIDPAGHVYVVDAQFEAVQIFDSQGRLLLDFGQEGIGPGQFWLPAGMFIDSKGWIWIADSYNRRIQVFEYLPGEAPS